jgi:hypothetical protein
VLASWLIQLLSIVTICNLGLVVVLIRGSDSLPCVMVVSITVSGLGPELRRGYIYDG